MPIDRKAPDVMKLGKDLKPGDVIRFEKRSNDTSIIMKINHLEKFYGGKDHYEFFSFNDCSCGTYTGHLDMNKKYTVIQGRDEIRGIFDRVELELLRHAADIMDHRRELIDIKSAAFDELNKKLEKKKKKR